MGGMKRGLKKTIPVAQPPILAVFPPWGGSAGADRMALQIYSFCQKYFIQIIENPETPARNHP